jgi:type I restriction-modification system DNA methylase subunit
MLLKYSPMYQAMQRLDDVLRQSSAYSPYGSEQLLACIALAKLASAQRLGVALDDLLNQSDWSPVYRAGLPSKAVSLLEQLFDSSNRMTSSAAFGAFETLKKLSIELKDAPNSAWDVLPYISADDRKTPRSGEYFMAQPVVELMLDMLRVERGSVWVPFDAGGQIAISAYRRGFHVNTASITGHASLTAELLICIETAGVKDERITSEVPRDGNGRPTVSADFVLAVPPVGGHSSYPNWRQWQSVDTGSYDRSEAWAVSELLQRARQRLIILTSHTWLFSAGQEKRLRQELINSVPPSLESITTLPGGVFSFSNIATAIACFDVSKQGAAIRMTNLAKEGDERNLSLLDLINIGHKLIMGFDGENKLSRMISVEEIRDAEYVLLPQRLLGRAMFNGGNSIQLGDICSAVRPTTPYKGSNPLRVLELGIPQLRDAKWLAIGDVYPNEPKTVNVKPGEKSDVFLRLDDILVSVKGSLGYARLVSSFYGIEQNQKDDSTSIRAVVSSSCIALRFDRSSRSSSITPKYLLMYLRSAEGQEQIKSLQVGAAMPHISVQSLLNSVRIPIPSADEIASVHEDFEKLCSLESQINSLAKDMESISESRWSVKLA